MKKYLKKIKRNSVIGMVLGLAITILSYLSYKDASDALLTLDNQRLDTVLEE